MRLINLATLKLEDFLSETETPPYAILSHTWGDEEVTLQDVLGNKALQKKGWQKITGFCHTIPLHSSPDIKYAWVDTCCIDKTSSAELSEAINAMFRWYRNAACCFAFLEDVEEEFGGIGTVGSDFEKSRWFTRGWTLQELLAPKDIKFFDKDWRSIGTKHSLSKRISAITRIDNEVLTTGNWSHTNVAHRMSWAAGRKTTRVEDMAYCLLGIFDINMPMLYGEGRKAFLRLQEEIIKEMDDYSILAWDSSQIPASVSVIGALAPGPDCFVDCDKFECPPNTAFGNVLAASSKGLQANLSLMQLEESPGEVFGVLPCISKGDLATVIAVGLVRDDESGWTRYSRTRAAPMVIPMILPVLESDRVLLSRKNLELAPTSAAGTRWWLKYFSGDHCEIAGVYPPDLWKRNDPTRTMTMTIPWNASSPVSSVAAFKTKGENSEFFIVAMSLGPQDGTARVEVTRINGMPPADETAVQELLKSRLVGEDETYGVMELLHSMVTVRCTLEDVRGSMTNCINLVCMRKF